MSKRLKLSGGLGGD